ncbi:hypothetical protein ABIC08_007693 [Bradyrhizobium sp. RT9b]
MHQRNETRYGRSPPPSDRDLLIFGNLAFFAGIALGFGWGVAVALGTGSIGMWLRGGL